MKEKLKQLSSSSPSPAQCNLFVHVKLLGCMQNTLTKIISTTQNMERIKHRHSFLLQFTLLCFHTTARGEWWIPCPNEFMQNKACTLTPCFLLALASSLGVLCCTTLYYNDVYTASNFTQIEFSLYFGSSSCRLHTNSAWILSMLLNAADHSFLRFRCHQVQ